MNRIIIFFLLVIIGCSGKNVNEKAETKVQIKPPLISLNSCPDFNSLNIKIRDGNITQDSALVEIQKLMPSFKTYYYAHGGKDFSPSDWIFPVQGCSANAIGGKNGNGYIESGYNYFDGNKHRGHPAQDIFIYDSNQDCLDDRNKRYVNVLSMTGGIVISLEKRWDSLCKLRGGKYIWVYDLSSNNLFYYAHNSKVIVNLGDIVKPGDTIATIGRSGLNAFKARSPTHLHLMQLKLDSNYYPKPVNCYQSLSKIMVK